MHNLKNLIKNTFNTDISVEEIELFEPQILQRVDSMVGSLRLQTIPFDDAEFKKVYDHQDYVYLKLFLDLYKDKKDLKLPSKDE